MVKFVSLKEYCVLMYVMSILFQLGYAKVHRYLVEHFSTCFCGDNFLI